jgi:small subunit ribosomal protein S1
MGMSENFAQLFEESVTKAAMAPGAIVSATVERIEGKYVVVSAGFKSECFIPVEQFYDDRGNIEVKAGDEVKVALETIEDGFGNTRLSRERARRNEAWARLEQAYETKQPVRGVISGRVKGGFTVEMDKIRAFLPGSLVDTKPIKDPEFFEGKEFEFKVIKIDAKRNNIVVSRRAALEAETGVERAALLENINEGQEIKGIVKNITDYGAFVDLGGVDGLLHITDMSWKRIKHPSELLAVGDEIKVRVLKIDRESNRVSLGIKQLGGDPWVEIDKRYAVGMRLKGRVTNVMDYGCFVELEEGIEGLVHVSEMDWTNKNINPSKVVHLGQEVEVAVLEVDNERRRISLGIKQCTTNPWDEYAKNHQKGERISGKIRSITDFGIFIGLDGGIDGLVYASDISWNETEAQEALRKFQKGDEIEAVILTIDPERERIALGLKQLADDPLSNYLTQHEKGNFVTGTVSEIDAKQALVELAEGVQGVLRAIDMAHDKVDDARTLFNIGDTVEAKVMGMDRKANAITLSIKAKDPKAKVAKPRKKKTEGAATTKTAKKSESGIKATLGDIFKEQMSNQESEEGEKE